MSGKPTFGEYVKQAILIALLPIGEFVKGWIQIWNPRQLARRILEDQLAAAELISIMLGSAFASALLGAIFHPPGGVIGDIVHVPVVNDLIVTGILGCAAVVFAGITFTPLRWLAGSASFRHTTIAHWIVLFLVVPVGDLVNGITGADLTTAHVFFGGGCLATLLANVHNISYRRAYVVTGLSAGLVLCVLIGLMRNMR
jgi:hypothetical protein